MTAGYVMVPGWLLAKKPTGIAQSAYNHLAKRGTFHPGLGTYEECRPSLNTLADDMGVNVKTARKAVQELEELGGVVGTPRYAEDGSQLPTVYRVIFGVLIEPGPPSQKTVGGGYQKSVGPPSQKVGGTPYQKVVDNQEPNTQNPTPTTNTTPPAPPVPDPFDRWWAVYPLKKGKIAAKKAFARALKATDLETLLAGVERYLTDAKVLAGYVKEPTTWLNGGHWDDDPTPVPAPRQAAGALVERNGMLLTPANAQAYDVYQTMRADAPQQLAIEDPAAYARQLEGAPW